MDTALQASSLESSFMPPSGVAGARRGWPATRASEYCMASQNIMLLRRFAVALPPSAGHAGKIEALKDVAQIVQERYNLWKAGMATSDSYQTMSLREQVVLISGAACVIRR